MYQVDSWVIVVILGLSLWGGGIGVVRCRFGRGGDVCQLGVVQWLSW